MAYGVSEFSTEFEIKRNADSGLHWIIYIYATLKLTVSCQYNKPCLTLITSLKSTTDGQLDEFIRLVS